MRERGVGRIERKNRMGKRLKFNPQTQTQPLLRARDILVNEEALLLAKFLRNKRKEGKTGIATIN